MMKRTRTHGAIRTHLRRCGWLCLLLWLGVSCAAPPDLEQSVVPLAIESGTLVLPTLPMNTPTIVRPPATPTPLTISPTMAAPTAARQLSAAVASDAMITLTGPTAAAPDGVFMGGWIDGEPAIVYVDSRGLVRTRYDVVGPFSYAAANDWLLVTTPDGTLHVINATTGALLRTVDTAAFEWEPTRDEPWPNRTPAFANTQAGELMVIAGNEVVVLDEQGAALARLPVVLTAEVCGELQAEPPDIAFATYDDSAEILYLQFITYVCTPWVNITFVAFNMGARQEIDRQQFGLTNWIVAQDGVLYGVSVERLLPGFRWAWQPGAPLLQVKDDSVGAWGGWVYDAQRQVLLEGGTESLRVVDPATMSVTETLDKPPGTLLHVFDDGRGLFLLEGALALHPLTADP